MRLKKYQDATKAVLSQFFRDARIIGPKPAFDAITTEEEQAKRLRGYGGAYRALPGLDAVPYVCLRLPTGGGKTLLAAHAITIARDSWLEREYPLVLWLVPSDAIRRQTADALKNPVHPYRAALDEAFQGRVRVFDIADFTQATPQDLRANLCVFVGTIQTLKITNTAGRKVYAHHEMLEPHYTAVSPNAPGLERNDDGPFKGQVKFSFANLLYLHRPLVIVDEAHNAVTGLAHEMQRRINPSAIIEFTATPKDRSNILHSVTAQELKDEQMIKLPVVLDEHKTWQEAVTGAIAKRAELAIEAAKDRAAYIRPIVLFQAQNKDQDVPVDVLRAYLIDTMGIDAAKVAVATGAQRELDGLNLLDPACPIEYVITVQALKEGWDCSFAYVFCSVANIRNSGDAEQLLGRVLRMPYATRRTAPALNKAYANLTSPHFSDAVRGLVDKLIDMGFDEVEIAENIESAQPGLADEFFQRQRRTEPSTAVQIDAPVEVLLGIEQAAPFKLSVGPDEQGRAQIKVKGFLKPAEKALVFEKMPAQFHGKFREAMTKYEADNRHLASPAQLGEEFVAPRLFTWVQGELALADSDVLFEHHDWTLKDHPHQLTEQDFSVRQVADTFEIDIDGGQVIYQRTDQTQQLMLDIDVDGWTEQGLVIWLDRKVRDRFVGQGELIRWLSAVVAHLIHQRGIPLSTLMRCQFLLARKLSEKLSKILAIERGRIYQLALFDDAAQPEVSFDNGFRFFDGMFDGVRMYQGRMRFSKHFTGWDQIPAFDGKGADGEEFQCAVALDRLPGLKYWIRNVSKHPNAYWLPLAGAKFYPDFVAAMEDGRTLVVEYKGDMLVDAADTKAKQAIGALMHSKSDRRGVFVMVEKQKNGLGMYEQLLAEVT